MVVESGPRRNKRHNQTSRKNQTVLQHVGICRFLGLCLPFARRDAYPSCAANALVTVVKDDDRRLVAPIDGDLLAGG